MQRFRSEQELPAARLQEKNRLIALYRDTDSDYSDYLQSLRQNINDQRTEAHGIAERDPAGRLPRAENPVRAGAAHGQGNKAPTGD